MKHYWHTAPVETWKKQMDGTRKLLKKYGSVKHIPGMRVPYLAVGGDNQFQMMIEQNFRYDASITAPLYSPPIWPYTMHYKILHRASDGQIYPQNSFPVWEMVMNRMGSTCLYDCFDDKEDAEFSPQKFYEFLDKSFNSHYTYNRAPFGIHRHWSRLNRRQEELDVLLHWIDDILTRHDDVYFVTLSQVIDWMQNTTPLSQIKNFQPWKKRCWVELAEPCSNIHNCVLETKDKVMMRNFSTCYECPKYFPW